MEKNRYIFLKIFHKINNYIANIKNILTFYLKTIHYIDSYNMKNENKDTDSLISEEGQILHYMKMNKKSKQVFGTAKPRFKKNKSVNRYSYPNPEKKVSKKHSLAANLGASLKSRFFPNKGLELKQNNSSNDEKVFKVGKANRNQLAKKINCNKFSKKFYPNEKIDINNERPSSISPSRHSIRFKI